MNRPPNESTFSIFIYCDDRSHAPRRVAVTNFDALPSGGWHERPASRAGATAGTGLHLIGDEPAAPGWALEDQTHREPLRDSHDLRCRKCGPRGAVPVRAENLARVLEGWRSLRMSEVALSDIAATLARKQPPRE